MVKRTNAQGKTAYYVIVEEEKPDGGRRRRWHSDPATGSAFTSRKAADAYAAMQINAVHSGGYIEPTRETVASWLDVWLTIIKPTVRASTWASYEKNVRLHIKPHVGNRELRRLNAADLDRLYGHLLSEGRVDHKSGAGLAARTVRYIATILGRALKDATRKGLIARNPAADADPPSASAVAAQPMRTWTADQLATFLDYIPSVHRMATLFAYLALTGCRRGEALGLRWKDVDLTAGRASIVQTVGKIAGKTVVGTTKTAAGRRVIALDAGLVGLLRRHRATQAAERLAIGPGWRDHDLVFPDPVGEPQYPETVSRVFVELAREIDLPKIRLHDLRHTWATLALQAAVHPKVVQERLGHANVGITLNVYSHVAPTLHDAAAETVASLIRRAVDDR